MDIGSKGFLEARIIIPKGTSLSFEIIHKDEDGNVIDHTGDEARMVFKHGAEAVDMSPCCTCGAESISVNIPAETSASFESDSYYWDMVIVAESTTRIAYGTVVVPETYSLGD